LLLFASHLIVARSSAFPQTDAFVLLWTTALVLLAARRSRAPRAWHGILCFALLVTGLFVKLSFLPALALLPLWRVVDALASRRRVDLVVVIKDAAVYSLLPYVIFLLAQRQLGLLHLYGVELRAIAGSDSHPAFVVLSCLHAAVLFAPLAWLGRRRFGSNEAALVGWIALYLAS